ncbi:sodium/potassium/calcium exchanger 1-like [Panicum hallii]|uniref:sodium/potassium/calcium exchanger 1-like n=1 Tax=Panicum hallii TaxID=206008 RepID=UPI000DF4D8DE|nr:sodium/potassium/calcium exchanger 1-like [Panicum hallii]
MRNYERWYEHGVSQEQEPYNLVDSFEENEDRMDAMMDDFVQQVENAVEEDECNGLFEVDIGMALDRLDGDTGDVIVSKDEQEEEGRGADEEEYVTNVDGNGDGGSGEGDGCEDKEECEDRDGDAEEEEEEDTAAQPVFR